MSFSSREDDDDEDDMEAAVVPADSIVRCSTANMVLMTCSMTAGTLLGWSAEWASSSAAHKSPVPVKSNGSMGQSIRHALVVVDVVSARRTRSDARMVMVSPSSIMLVIKTRLGPILWSASQARLASSNVSILMLVSCSTSNYVVRSSRAVA